jgi:hypothetical protein
LQEWLMSSSKEPYHAAPKSPGTCYMCGHAARDPADDGFQIVPPLVTVTTPHPWQCLAGDKKLLVPVS